MSDSWATAFNLSYLAAGPSIDNAGRLVALAGQRQAERRLAAASADHDYLMQHYELLWDDLQRFIVYGKDVAAANFSLRQCVDRLSQEIASLRQNESLFLQEAVDLRDYNSRLCEENAALRQWGDQLCEENAALRKEVDDLREERT